MYTELVKSIGFIYGIVVVCGGLMGYLQAASIASLSAGLGAGSLAMLGGYLVSKSTQYVDLGLKILLGVSIALVLVFQARIKQSGFKFMPSGFMIINSLFIVVLCALALKERSEKPVVVDKPKNKKI